MNLKEVGKYMIDKGLKKLEICYNDLGDDYVLDTDDDNDDYSYTIVSLYNIETTNYINEIYNVLDSLPIETDDVDINTLITLCLGTTDEEKKIKGAEVLIGVLEHLIPHSEMQVFDNYVIVAEDD